MFPCIQTFPILQEAVVKEWMLRWENHITATAAALKNLGSCELRKLVKVYNKFSSELEEKVTPKATTISFIKS